MLMVDLDGSFHKTYERGLLGNISQKKQTSNYHFEF